MTTVEENVISSEWLELIKPTDYVVDKKSEDNYIFKISPLARGMGTTIGNSLRRVLLSSLYGAAITSMNITGVRHIFDSMPGVREDVLAISQNVKNVRVKYTGSKKKKGTLKVKTPGPVTAGMISFARDVEIINKDLVLCHLEPGAALEAVFTLEVGRGYLPVEKRDNVSNMPIGEILLDAVFSPIKNVSYSVDDNFRVGADTQNDRLRLNILTDGSINPELALSIAANIIATQLDLLKSLGNVSSKGVEEQVEEDLPFNPILFKKIKDLEFSVRSHNCLAQENWKYLGDIVTNSENRMLKIPNFGRKSLNEMKDILSTMSLRFGMNIPDWPPKDVDALSKRYEEIYNL